MIGCLIDATIKVIQILESLIGLAYEPGLEPLLVTVTYLGIQAIPSRFEGVELEVSTRGYLRLETGTNFEDEI